MESSYSIQPLERLVRMQVWGELTVDGLIGLIDRVGADEHYRSSMHAIADFRQSFEDPQVALRWVQGELD